MRPGALRRWLGIAWVVVVTASACTKEKRSLPPSSGGTISGAATLSSIQADIFTESCGTSGCHDSRANPAANLNLTSAAATYAALVNKPSAQAFGMNLVVPGDAAHSYLVNKLDGTFPSVGGSGVRMPQFSAALTGDQMERIITWINDGAALN